MIDMIGAMTQTVGVKVGRILFGDVGKAWKEAVEEQRGREIAEKMLDDYVTMWGSDGWVELMIERQRVRTEEGKDTGVMVWENAWHLANED